MPAVVLAVALGSFAQEERQSSFYRNNRLFTGLHVEYWNYQQIHTLETVLPVYYSLGLENVLEGLAFDVVTSPTMAMNGGEMFSSTNVLFAVANTKIRSSLNINDVVLVTAGLQIPTGSNQLSAEQRHVVGAVSSRQMNFKIARFQTGFDLDFTAASSYQFSDELVLGMAAGYLLHLPFTPIEDVPGVTPAKYDPGDEIAITVGADIKTLMGGLKTRIMGDFMTNLYLPDKDGGNKVFRAGPRFSVDARMDMKASNGKRNLAVLSINIFGKDKVILPGSDLKRAQGDQFSLTDYLYPGKWGEVSPFAIMKVSLYTPNDNDAGRALLGGLGGGLRVPVRKTLNLRLQFLVEGGGMGGDAILGSEIGGGLQYVF